MPSWPGSTAMMPPQTPLFAGRPTVYIHSPAPSYMPHVAMTLSTDLTVDSEAARAPGDGLRPPAARVAAMTARSWVSTAMAHWRK